jgi:hemerythrin
MAMGLREGMMGLAARDLVESGPCAQLTELNKLHIRLQEMVREAILAINRSAAPEVIEVMLRRIVDCSKDHVLEEDRIVSETTCGQCLPRNCRHQKFFDATMDLSYRFKAGGRIEALELLEHLDDWLSDHISKKHKCCQKLGGN